MATTNRVRDKIAAAYLELDLKPEVANDIVSRSTGSVPGLRYCDSFRFSQSYSTAALRART